MKRSKIKILEAIENLKYLISDDCTDNPINFIEEIEMAINALEKQVPKRPIEDNYYNEPAVCPNCGGNIANQCDYDYQFQYCHYCGQKLDWRDHSIEKGGKK